MNVPPLKSLPKKQFSPPSPSQNQLPTLDHQRTRKETSNSHHKPRKWSERKKSLLISVPYVPGLSEEFRRIWHHTNVQVMFKGANTLKSISICPKDKISLNLKQNIVHKWSCPEECCSQSYIGESSRCLENRVNEHSSPVTSVIFHLQ